MTIAEPLRHVRTLLKTLPFLPMIALRERSLLRLVARQIAPADAPIIELGAHRGALTQQLLLRGIPPGKLALVDYRSEFAVLLKRQYPEARVLLMNASGLSTVDPFDGEKAGAVLSRLPLDSLPVRQVMLILNSAFTHLRQGGRFYQIASSLRCPAPDHVLARLDLRADRVCSVLTHAPPIAIYCFTRDESFE